MEGIELRVALTEAHLLVGARLSKVHQVGDVFLLRFYRPSGALALDPGGKAFHLTALRPVAPPAPPPFCGLLRTLAGQPLIALEQAGVDRVLRLRFLEADLVLDLRPRQGDLFFIARDGRVASLRGDEPRAVDFSMEDEPIQGLGPELKRAAAAFFGRAASDPELAAWVADLLSRPPAGYVHETKAGLRASFFARPDLGEPAATFPTFWQALDRVLERRLGSAAARGQKEQIERAIRRRERALATLAAAEGEAKTWPELQSKADLILTRLSEIPAGAREIEVEGFDGQPVRLALDPAVRPLAQAQALYRKAGKLRRRLEHNPVRRRELEEETARLRELVALLSHRPDLAPYLEGEVAGFAPAPKPASDRAAKRARPRGLAVNGFPILVGRSGQENDRLVRAARPTDVWLHARGVPGGHVVIRTGGQPVPKEVLERAAELAAWHSRARGERKVPVSYTEARYVRKPKGVPPGMVTLLREDVIVVSGENGP
ncbi:MAG: NFACT RNA binding domain-containing protein [Candidatus Bipolaricaulota bacterium]